MKDLDLQPKLFVDLDLEETCVTKATIIRHRNELAEVVYEGAAFDVHDGSSGSLWFRRVSFHRNGSLHLAPHGSHKRRSDAILRFSDIYEQRVLAARVPSLPVFPL